MEAKVITLETKRTGYSVNQVVDKTITVGELRDYLEEFDEDDFIMFSNDNGYTFGEITDNAISVYEYDEEEERYIRGY